MLERAGQAPLDLESAFASRHWRRDLFWPVSIGDMRAASRVPVAALARLVASADDRDRDVLLLAGPLLAFFARQMIDVTLVLEAAPQRGVTVTATGTVHKALSGDEAAARKLTSEWLAWGRDTTTRSLLLRRVGRIASWSSPIGTLRALVAPQAMAISHNSLLIDGARRSGLAVGFDHAEQMLARAKRGRQAGAGEAAEADLAERVVAEMLSGSMFSGKSIQRMTAVLLPVARCILTRARGDLLALAAVPFPVSNLWSATGAKWAARALGLAAMRQGCVVRRFEHVGTGCLVADGLGFDMTERAVSTEVVVPTAQLAGFAEKIRSRDLEPLGALLSGAGDPDFVFPSTAGPRGTPLRVVYATTLLRGALQYHDALLPDAVYLDWQMRVGEALSVMPFNAIVKPHPETRYPGNRNPLPDVAKVSSEPFERLIADCDVFVFDFGQTTVFWKGLATAKPVVYLDLGLTSFQPEVRAELERRATIVPVAYDERNRPVLNAALLESAITQARPADFSNPFRQWLGGA